MRRSLSIVLISLFSLSTPAFAWQGRVVSVTDGDTIKVLHGGRGEKVRLYGVDTPEKKQDFGQAARQVTAGMVAGKTVEVEPVENDRYGRTVGMVAIDGKCVNEELVQLGYAWVYEQYCKRPECGKWKELEGQAREKRLGLWKDGKAVAPWDWRRKK